MKRIIFFAFLLMIVLSFGCINAEVNSTNPNSSVENQTNMNQTNMTAVTEISLNNFMPQEVQLGDVQFNLQIENNGNDIINNIFAFISGNGFSTYDITPIDSLASGEEGIIFVSGNVKQEGNISLTIRINEETFYQNITVIDPNNESAQKLEELRKAQEKEQQIQNISGQLDELKESLKNLETELNDKKNNGYDVSQISLDYLRSYIRSIQADILTGNVNDANVNIELANEEYLSQKDSIDNAKPIPFINKIKDYALIFSTIAGSIITLFALYELLKKKRENLTETITKKMIKKKPQEKESKKE